MIVYGYPYERPSWLHDFRVWLAVTARCALAFLVVVGYSLGCWWLLFLAAKAAL